LNTHQPAHRLRSIDDKAVSTKNLEAISNGFQTFFHFLLFGKYLLFFEYIPNFYTHSYCNL